jgi:hypothetical protein
VDYDCLKNDARTYGDQSETGGDFRVSYESLIDEDGQDHLYFIRVKDGPVKIGRARDAWKRLRGLQCACPYDLQMVGILRGGGGYEACFHANLEQHRLRGEWFEWVDVVERVIRAALNGGRWRSVFGIEEPEDFDWRDGSPLYEPMEKRHVST